MKKIVCIFFLTVLMLNMGGIEREIDTIPPKTDIVEGLNI